MFWSIVIFLDFLKVLRFSFPVPVVGPSAKLALSLFFSAENIKNLPLALRARKKNRDQLVGKSIISPTSHLAGSEVECLAHAWDLHCNSCNHDLSIPNLVRGWSIPSPSPFLTIQEIDSMKLAKQQIKIQFCSMQIQNSLPIGASVPALGLSNKAVFDGEYYFTS